MSVVFGLSICMAKCNSLLFGMKMIYWDCFLWAGGCWGYSKKVGLRVAEKMKMCSYLHMGKIITHRMFPTGWTISSVCIVPDTRN